MRNYLQQIRQETGLRLCEKVFDPATDKPSKVVVLFTSNLCMGCILLLHSIPVSNHTIFVGMKTPAIYTPQPLRAGGVLFSPMVSGWAGGWVAGKSLFGLYLRNCKV